MTTHRTPQQFCTAIRRQIEHSPEMCQSVFTDKVWGEMADRDWRKIVLRLVREQCSDVVTHGEFTYDAKTGDGRVFTARILGRDQAPVLSRGPKPEVSD